LVFSKDAGAAVQTVSQQYDSRQVLRLVGDAVVAKPFPSVPFERQERLGATQEIRSLNSIRGLAALAIALYHAPVLFGVVEIFPHAYLAVDLFFVLSGFVMMHAYGERVRMGLSLGRFAQLRLARLYPLLVIATVAGLALWTVKVATGHIPFKLQTLIALPLNLCLLPGPSAARPDQAAYPFVTQSWSIGWEVVLGFALFVWVRHVRWGAAILAALFALVLAWVAMTRGGLDGGWTTPTLWVGGVRATFSFWAGVAIRQATLRRSPGPVVGLAAIAAACAAIFYTVAVHQTYWWADYAAVAAAFPLIIAAASSCRSRALENIVGDRLGEASYSIYLLQGVSLASLASLSNRFAAIGPVGHLLFGLSWLGALMVGAWLSWRWVETPLRLYFSRARYGAREAVDTGLTRVFGPRL